MVVRRLIEGVNLRDDFILDVLSQGILSLAKSDTTTETISKIKELFQEYMEVEKGQRQEIERAGREMLHHLRVSGTSISHVNIRAKEEWQNKLNRVANPYEERLSTLKHRLLS